MANDKTNNTQADEPVNYDPDIRSLAYAMESMNHTERCAALAQLAEEQHAIGIKNGRFGYVPKAQVSKDIAEIIGKSPENPYGKKDAFMNDWGHQASEYDKFVRKNQCERAKSKGYDVTHKEGLL